jgi:hypothetical protein
VLPALEGRFLTNLYEASHFSPHRLVPGVILNELAGRAFPSGFLSSRVLNGESTMRTPRKFGKGMVAADAAPAVIA